MLPGLFAAVQRNTSRGNDDLALFEAGPVFFRAGRRGGPAAGGRPAVPSDAELAAIDAALPVQPRHLAAVLTGDVASGRLAGRRRAAPAGSRRSPSPRSRRPRWASR